MLDIASGCQRKLQQPRLQLAESMWRTPSRRQVLVFTRRDSVRSCQAYPSCRVCTVDPQFAVEIDRRGPGPRAIPVTLRDPVPDPIAPRGVFALAPAWACAGAACRPGRVANDG